MCTVQFRRRLVGPSGLRTPSRREALRIELDPSSTTRPWRTWKTWTTSPAEPTFTPKTSRSPMAGASSILLRRSRTVLDRANGVAQLRGALEGVGVRGGDHLGAQVLGELVLIPLEQQLRLTRPRVRVLDSIA